MKRPEIYPYIYSQLTFDKVLRQFDGERRLIPTNGIGTSGYLNANE